MDILSEFNRIMKTTAYGSLATSTDGQPNVRIINFVWNEAEKVMYFCTFHGTSKIADIEKNGKVAFTTIPAIGLEEHVRVSRAVAKKSAKSVADVKGVLVEKYPHFEQMFAAGLEKFAIYEVRFEKADVVLGFGQHDVINF
jgi:uncharacterized pyridoxamine 5'-phosphate oxidase family protein